MSSDEVQNSSDAENTCVVCFKTVDIYSIGVCDHPVCFECSTRMRVVCRQNECPICRQDLPQVIFTKEVQAFSELSARTNRSTLQDRKTGIVFCSPNLQRAYYKLLEHNCNICNSKDRKWGFKTFQQLKEHMRREHELFYCDLCVDNLKIFTFERRCYTRKELAQHRRKGDAENTSHRGHPLCEFCDTRYVDSDELFRHLRRDHLFCHFCDADGKHEFYNTYDDLRNHFLEKHHLCEEGDCRQEMLTAVFRTDIDLKAHVASVHSRNLSKSATRQARTLELEFTLAPRQRLENVRSNNPVSRPRNPPRDEDLGAVGFEAAFTEPGGPGGGRRNNPNSLNSDNFPTLGSTSDIPTVRPVTSVTFSKVRDEQFRGEDFPVLGGVAQTNHRQLRSADDGVLRRLGENGRAPDVTISRALQGFNPRSSKEFPKLGEPSTSAGGSKSTLRLSVNSTSSDTSHPPNVSIQVKHKPNGAISTSIRASAPAEAFPALGNATPVSEPQWVPAKPKKTAEVPKAAKVAPPPALPPSGLADFPSLAAKPEKKGKKTSKVTVPVTESWVNLNSLKGEGDRKGAKVNPNDESSETEVKTKSKKKKPKNSETDDRLCNGLVKKRSELKIEANASAAATVPPPGFHVKPPPGFESPPVANDLTFTNSTGQSYSIRPITRYIQPENFAKRNRNLIESFMGIVRDNGMIREFKSYSDLFRNGTLPADKFYEHCKSVLSEKFDEVFPELLALLPDIEKQQALYGVHVLRGGNAKGSLMTCAECNQVVLKRERGKHQLYHGEKGDD